MSVLLRQKNICIQIHKNKIYAKKGGQKSAFFIIFQKQSRHL